MHWRRLIAAALEHTAEFLDLFAEEIDPPPPPKIRVRKPKATATAKPEWYP